MDPDESSPPLAKQARLASSCQVSDLSDGDLAEIFRHLPPFDRLLISEVCQRWHGISRIAWTDISYLDLSSIPGQYITAVIKQCPHLRTVTASRKTFIANELHVLSRVSLHSLRLYDCRVANIPAAYSKDPMSAVFSSSLRTARWDELVLDELSLAFQGMPTITDKAKYPAFFPTSLKRLQVCDVKWSHPHDSLLSLRGLEQFSELECLALQGHVAYSAAWASLASFAALQNLRELAFVLPRFKYARPLLSLPKLEVLFLNEVLLSGAGLEEPQPNDDFVKLVTKHPTLRILALPGCVHRTIDFPARVRYGNGFSEAPLPKLHIFVGKSASQQIRFPKFPSDAAKVYPISEPLPQFLEREDIKPIFDGVWTAEKIKEADRRGAGFYKRGYALATSFRSIDS